MNKIFLLFLAIITSPLMASSHRMSFTIFGGGGGGSSASERISHRGPAPFEDIDSSRSDRRAMLARAECEYLEYSMPTLYVPPPYTPSQAVKDLEEATTYYKQQVEKHNLVKRQIKEMDQYETRREIVGYATKALKIAGAHYRAEELEEGNFASQIADTLLDLATSLTPGISWGRDLYEAISGKDLHSGEDLGSTSRSMAVLGAVTVGFGSKISKAFTVFKKLMVSQRGVEAITNAEKIIDSAASLSRELKGGVNFRLAPRVTEQLIDPRLGSLAGKLDESKINTLLNAPGAQRFLDANSGHINIIQQVEDKLLRITVTRDEFKVISVGPIRPNGITNGIENARFIPLK